MARIVVTSYRYRPPPKKGVCFYVSPLTVAVREPA
jgi:hypothetical protein